VFSTTAVDNLKVENCSSRAGLPITLFLAAGDGFDDPAVLGVDLDRDEGVGLLCPDRHFAGVLAGPHR